jgi:predicted nucleotidyltransferase
MNPEVIEKYIDDSVCVIALFGSRARGDNGRYSDTDIVRLTRVSDEPQRNPGISNVMIEGILTSISTMKISDVENWFVNPALATEALQGLRDAQAMYDPEGVFSNLQKRALSFQWDDELQKKANEYVGEQLVGWAEEAYKGMEGLLRNDEGRLLQAKYGLTWGIAKLMTVYKGILATSENTFFYQIQHCMGADSDWTESLRKAFGVSPLNSPLPVSGQVAFGLRLYLLTYRIARKDLSPEHLGIIEHTASLIEEFLDNRRSQR